MEDQSPTTDSGLVGSRFQDGDAGATEEVRLRVRRTLSFRGFGIPAEERRDLEQIVMTQLWEATEQAEFDPTAGFWGFVDLVVTRRCIDWRRTRKTEVPFDPSMAGADPAAGPLDSTLQRERQAQVRAALERLPEPCRELIRLRLEQSMSYAEAARLLGTGEGALRVRMHRCIAQAQGMLRQLGSTGKAGRDL